MPEEAPETPPDEPQPAPVQDPPAEPIEAPYVVRTNGPSRARDTMQNPENSRNDSGARRRENGGPKERRGFASMSPEKQREIASKGGRAAHEKGTAHEWTSEEARNAGRKGGQISRGGRGRLAEGFSPLPEAPDEGGAH